MVSNFFKNILDDMDVRNPAEKKLGSSDVRSRNIADRNQNALNLKIVL